MSISSPVRTQLLISHATSEWCLQTEASLGTGPEKTDAAARISSSTLTGRVRSRNSLHPRCARRGSRRKERWHFRLHTAAVSSSFFPFVTVATLILRARVHL